jgi:cytoskeletal protein RodZ
MKKRQFKLFASIVSLALVIAIVTVGVWALNQYTVSVTNTVSFTAKGQVMATITGTKAVDETNTNLKTPGADIAGITIDNTTTETAAGTLAIGTVELEAKAEGPGETVIFIYTVTVANDHTTGASGNSSLKVTFTAPTNGANGTVDVAYTGVTGAAAVTTLAPEETITMTVTITFDANVTFANETYNGSIALEAVAAV